MIYTYTDVLYHMIYYVVHIFFIICIYYYDVSIINIIM